MSRIALAWILWCVCLWGADWSVQKEITLKRNEIYEMKILAEGNEERNLRFYWSLFKGEGLVLVAKYDLFNYQNLLYKDYDKNTWKVILYQSQKGISPYLLISFRDYDEKSQKVTFALRGFGDIYVAQEGVVGEAK